VSAGFQLSDSEEGQAMARLDREGIGLNFMRPDVGRPGNYDFLNSGVWLVEQFKKLGVKWNRLAFSWVLIEQEEGRPEWGPYDRIVEACEAAGIEIVATLGGHFDRPPVPAWAGESLAEVVRKNAGALERFIEAWVGRYKRSIRHWEMLNEPRTFHEGLTVLEYVEGVLKPGYRIVKGAEAGAVLPCAYGQLPVLGEREEFWEAARGHYDIHNEHMYVDWGLFRTRPTAEPEERAVRRFLRMAAERGEGDKPLWMTEIGWWGTGNIASDWVYGTYKRDPMLRSVEFRPSYRGKEILEHPVVLREDGLRAEWLADMYRRLLGVPGCEKVFLWVSMDEFEGGYDPAQVYGMSTAEQPAAQVDLWGIIAGDKSWRKSAHALQELTGGEHAGS
jgi:hypothetical protein